jgi:hypothetical protein
MFSKIIHSFKCYRICYLQAILHIQIEAIHAKLLPYPLIIEYEI